MTSPISKQLGQPDFISDVEHMPLRHECSVVGTDVESCSFISLPMGNAARLFRERRDLSYDPKRAPDGTNGILPFGCDGPCRNRAATLRNVIRFREVFCGLFQEIRFD